MTNEWGAPIPGEEMKALKGRIDPETLINRCGSIGAFKHRVFGGRDWHLPANHPYYKIREYNQKHGTNLVLHDGSGKVPEDWDGGYIMSHRGSVVRYSRDAGFPWGYIIAYTPKPKESEVTEQFPKDEAIEYVCSEYFGYLPEKVKDQADQYEEVIEMARLIQQYEPDRLKSAVDVAAGNYTRDLHGHVADTIQRAFKAGAAWQKENGK